MEETKQTDASVLNNKKREDKVRRKDNRAPENIIKEIKDQAEEDKLAALMTKYTNLYDEFRTTHLSRTVAEKRCTVLQKERDQLQSDQTKLLLARSRMESLCRELQRQNKMIKDDNLAKIREEDDKRKGVAATFQKTLNELTTMMEENSQKNSKLREDNRYMADKIEELYKEYEQSKQYQSKMEKQIDLEKQLAAAQINKIQLQFKAEKELWAKEREALEEKYKQSEDCCQLLRTSLKSVQGNLKEYSEKYDEFETSVNKSSKMFNDCKTEMDKHLLLAQKEAKMWKQSSQKNSQKLLEVSESMDAQGMKLEITEKKLEQLQRLCRQLQVDRSSYLKILKANGIEAVSQKCVDNSVQSQQEKQIAKHDKQLENLRGNLQLLQEQLNDKLSVVDNCDACPNSKEAVKGTKNTRNCRKKNKKTSHNVK